MPTMYQDRKLPAPPLYPESEPFWQAAAEGRLLLKRGADCGAYHWYPRVICPHCGSDRTEWTPSPGTGTIYTVSVTRRAGPVVFAIGYVSLDEGVTMLTNFADCDLDALRIGQRVRVVFKPTDGGPPVPMFTAA